MYVKTLLVAAALASSAAADLVHMPGHMNIHQARDRILARQTLAPTATAPSDACLSEIASLASDIPTPPPAILSYEMTNTAFNSDPCAAVTLPASLSSAFKSYETELSSWYKANSAELDSVLSACPVASGYISTGAAGCSKTESVSVAGPSTTGSSAQTTGSSGSGSSTSGSAGAAGASTTKSAGAAPRETGLVAMAVAAAGFLGAVAAL